MVLIMNIRDDTWLTPRGSGRFSTALIPMVNLVIGLERNLAHLRRTEREAALKVVEAIEDEDLGGVLSALAKCQTSGDALRLAARLVARRCKPGSPEFQRALMRDLWCQHGDALRQDVGDDRALIGMLSAIFSRPVTIGPLTLWRGETATNRLRRTYGLSWTSTKEVARAFASEGRMRAASGGTVVLEAVVPTDAIIAAVDDHAGDTGEREFLVDRRRLTNIAIIERYSPGLFP